MDDRIARTRVSYDRVAAEYARRLADELDQKALERDLLDRFHRGLTGRICDLGCGPGQVARYLHDRGAAVLGVDLSSAMVLQARRRHRDIAFLQGDMRTLPLADDALAGIVAFYSLIHVPRDEATMLLRELRRVLRLGGRLLAGFHAGGETLHTDEWWGEPVSLDLVLFEPKEMAGYLEEAGFVVEDSVERPPYPEIEYQSERAYVFARNPP